MVGNKFSDWEPFATGGMSNTTNGACGTQPPAPQPHAFSAPVSVGSQDPGRRELTCRAPTVCDAKPKAGEQRRPWLPYRASHRRCPGRVAQGKFAERAPPWVEAPSIDCTLQCKRAATERTTVKELLDHARDARPPHSDRRRWRICLAAKAPFLRAITSLTFTVNPESR